MSQTEIVALVGVVRNFGRVLLASLMTLVFTQTALANGPIGEHVNDLQGHLDEYAEEVTWLIGKVDGIVSEYQNGGLEAAKPEAVVDHWEAVKFHAAIETNYVPLYASIWQGLFGVRGAIEEEQSLSSVRAEQAILEHTLYQALGAVKMAAKFQASGAPVAADEGDALSPTATLNLVNERLDRVVAKYAERLDDEAIEIVQDTYLSLFEGVEGAIIEQDADLVEDLEIDFNVTLPKAIQDGKSVDAVREVVSMMHGKVDRAKVLIADAEKSRSSVF
ncbi:MAG: hypothetical protein AAF662_09050 [Pseudomonadota bacterium]